MGPLGGVHVLEYARGPAAGFAGLLLRELGARTTLLEPASGSTLRDWPPRSGHRSTLHSYLAAGKDVATLDSLTASHIAKINVVVHDDGLPLQVAAALDAAAMPARGRAVVRCTPYGATGPKRDWQGSELSLFQAGGEGYLMPHGLPFEEHPDRPPIGIGRYSAHYQGGIATALAAVAALRHSRANGRTEHVDVSIQDAQLSLNYFTVSRYVDGVRESRSTRAFRYGGILRCLDGWVELVPLENHHWTGILALLGHPPELLTSEFEELLSRARHGDRINVHLRRWAAALTVADVVARAGAANVPCGPYLAPADLPNDAQLAHRGYFVSDSEHPARADLFPGPAWVLSRWPKPQLRPARDGGGPHAPA